MRDSTEQLQNQNEGRPRIIITPLFLFLSLFLLLYLPFIFLFLSICFSSVFFSLTSPCLTQGDLKCPQCHTVLGKYCWSGMSCSYILVVIVSVRFVSSIFSFFYSFVSFTLWFPSLLFHLFSLILLFACTRELGCARICCGEGRSSATPVTLGMYCKSDFKDTSNIARVFHW